MIMRRFSLVLLAALLALSVSMIAAQEEASPAATPDVTESAPGDAPLRVTEVLPSPDTQNVAADAAITVIFNRPVVPLVVAEEMDTLPDPLTITPSVAGEGEWLNTSIYMFRPDPAFAGGREYTVTV